ncbi:MAG: YaeQ family protein [Halioglobus sp.]|nr:YaeQ family protein [Halioglobus sp.]
MALKPTIYKAQVALADSDRGRFDDLSLTLARHPSETMERMATRLLAYCLHAAPGLEFTRGLSTGDEPDLWCRSAAGELEHWIEVGQPEEPRLRKACGRSARVTVYAFGRSSTTWWKLNGVAITALPRMQVLQLDWAEVVALAGLLERTSRLTVSVVGGVVYVDNGGDTVSLEPKLLFSSSLE